MLGQLNKILEISDSEAGLKVEKSAGVFGEEGECGDDDVELLVRERRSLDAYLMWPCLEVNPHDKA